MQYVHGVGDAVETACVMSAARAKWMISQGMPIDKASDQLDCACPVMRVLAIHRNDNTPIKALQSWAPPMIDRLINSRGSKEITKQRVNAIAHYAITVIAADALNKACFSEKAKELRSLAPTTPMKDIETTGQFIFYSVADAYHASLVMDRAISAVRNAIGYASRGTDNDANMVANDVADAALILSINDGLVYLDTMISLVEKIK